MSGSWYSTKNQPCRTDFAVGAADPIIRTVFVSTAGALVVVFVGVGIRVVVVVVHGVVGVAWRWPFDRREANLEQIKGLSRFFSALVTVPAVAVIHTNNVVGGCERKAGDHAPRPKSKDAHEETTTYPRFGLA